MKITAEMLETKKYPDLTRFKNMFPKGMHVSYANVFHAMKSGLLTGLFMAYFGTPKALRSYNNAWMHTCSVVSTEPNTHLRNCARAFVQFYDAK